MKLPRIVSKPLPTPARYPTAMYRQCAAKGMTIAEAASALSRNVSTVLRVAARHGISFTPGKTGRVQEYAAVQVGPNTYASVKDASQAEHVAASSIYACLRRGTPEKIGSRKHRQNIQGAK